MVIHVAEKCRKLYSAVEGSTAQQKALLCNKKLYRTIESYTTQQKILLYSRKLYCTAESFTTQQKVLLYNRKFYCTIEKLVLWQKSEKSSFCSKSRGQAHFVASSLGLWTHCLRTNWQWQNGTLEPIPPSARHNFLLRKRSRLSVVQ